ncbi:NUMOD4 motif-containing HNH endonuclease [Periweissella fabalis]|uniref:HNH homing endonuclease n=1 Tax=Periweissella fabalis TaxID=1070421 RepID=A0A7X6S462_9LACO|nr:NUMOD4 motif-containing HNH endonuclease [Periweissella fabalis]MCM0598304.1 NUMOD4 motif-containing HNH endonuclease [Periweissella fabalis]NKZ24936.1 hypothetical protein [Periweissella fabalis]
MIEQWKPVPAYEDKYEASNLGVVRNIKTKHVLKPYTRGDDKHLMVNLSINGLSNTVRVHRIVATLFVPNYKFNHVVHHIDNDPTNNRYDNLMWVTQQQNVQFQQRTKKIHVIKDDEIIMTFAGRPEFINKVGYTFDRCKRLMTLKDGEYYLTYTMYQRLINGDIPMADGDKNKQSLGGKAKIGRGKVQQWVKSLSDSEHNELINDMNTLKGKEFQDKYNRRKDIIKRVLQSA